MFYQKQMCTTLLNTFFNVPFLFCVCLIILLHLYHSIYVVLGFKWDMSITFCTLHMMEWE